MDGGAFLQFKYKNATFEFHNPCAVLLCGDEKKKGRYYAIIKMQSKQMKTRKSALHVSPYSVCDEKKERAAMRLNFL